MPTERAVMPTRAPGGRSVARTRAQLGLIDGFKRSGSEGRSASLMCRHARSAGEAGASPVGVWTTAGSCAGSPGASVGR
jgi:hypothetical protein